MREILFLVSGKAEAGKDTFFALAKELTHSSACHRFAFGDEVKKVAYDLTWNGEKDQAGRTLLQWLGDGARAYNNDVWVEKTQAKIFSWQEMRSIFGTPYLTNYLFVTDCRYPNEIEKMKNFAMENGIEAVSVRVERPTHISKLTEEQLKNTSETALDGYGFDFVITNDGDLASYKDQVREVLECLK